jgi:hypothetical protein
MCRHNLNHNTTHKCLETKTQREYEEEEENSESTCSKGRKNGLMENKKRRMNDYKGM